MVCMGFGEAERQGSGDEGLSLYLCDAFHSEPCLGEQDFNSQFACRY